MLPKLVADEVFCEFQNVTMEAGHLKVPLTVMFLNHLSKLATFSACVGAVSSIQVTLVSALQS